MEEQRRNILITAGKEMAARGIRAVTMDEIASRLGISKKTIYTYFKDKDAIVEAIFTTHITHLFTDEQPQAGDIAEQLATHMLYLARHTHTVCPQFTEDLRRFYPELLSDFYTARREMAHRVLGELLARGVAAGEVRADADLEVAIDFITELPGLLVGSERIAQLGYPNERLQMGLQELIINGLLTESGQAKARKFLINDTTLQTKNRR